MGHAVIANWVAEKMGSYESLKEPTLPLPSPRTKQVDDVERLTMESEDAIAYERNCPLVQVRGVTNGIKQCPHWIARHPWTYEREMTRDLTPSLIGILSPYGIRDITVTDRSSAHAAAWHSPKRPAEDLGNHFQLDDCRVWLRLHFWGCRKAGVFPPTNSRANTTTKTEAPPLALATQQRFQDWYMKFLSHFIRIYERTAQKFVPLEAAWSLSSENITRYEKALETGSAGMEEVIDILNPREAMSKIKSL